MERAFVFPGQGSQTVGMGRELAESFPAAREVFEEVDDSLGQSLSRIMWEGPEDELRLTENTQPALMAMSLAVVRVLETEFKLRITDACRFVAGHSLGEYSALAAAETFSLSDTARLLKVRGRAMQEAVPVGEGAMAALIGAEFNQATEIAAAAAQGEVCDPANDNAPGQVVISGTASAIDRAIEIAKEKGIKRSILLPVSAPFHCAMLAPAAQVMESALADVEAQKPVVPLIANVTAAPVEDPAEIRTLLVQQVTAMVRWRESVLTMGEAGVEAIIELGAGKVLSGLTRRINSDLTAMNIAAPEDFESFAKTL